MRNNSSKGDGGEMCAPIGEPLRTLTTAGQQSVIEWADSHEVYAYDTGLFRPVTEPLPTQTAVAGDAFFDRDVELDVDDCTLRMLEPAEIGLGMAFGPDYVVLGNKRVQARQYGNAVTPPVVELLGLALREAITGEHLEPHPQNGG